jgi:AraC-like DNA-binding protein
MTTPLAHDQQFVLYQAPPSIHILQHRFSPKERAVRAGSAGTGNLFICLNLEGTLCLYVGDSITSLGLRTVAVSANARTIVRSVDRDSSSPHHFLTIELSKAFWAESLEPRIPVPAIRSPLREFLRDELEEGLPILWKESMAITVQNLAWALVEPPVLNRLACPLWYEAKIYELVTLLLLEPEEMDPNERLTSSSREQIVGRKKIEMARSILERDYVNPPSLEMLAAEVGCGAYHLSRIFSRETGLTIPQYLREIRLDRAERLLRSGRCNVTQAAFAVGYQSLSHFSKAFWERFGCCPGLYGNPKIANQVRTWGGGNSRNVSASSQSDKLRAA